MDIACQQGSAVGVKRGTCAFVHRGEAPLLFAHCRLRAKPTVAAKSLDMKRTLAASIQSTFKHTRWQKECRRGLSEETMNTKRLVKVALGTAVLAAALACFAAPKKGSKASTQAASLSDNSGAKIALSSLAHRTEGTSAPVVYFTPQITADALIKAYDALSWKPVGKLAIKLSTGEPPASNYLRADLIGGLVGKVGGTIVECNTAYGGSRAETAMHYQVAKDHGFTALAPFQIMDEKGSMTLPVAGGTVLKENYVGAAFADYDSYLVLSHFKGHAMAGFGGAIKNISIGLGSSEGKMWIHTGGKSRTTWRGGTQDEFLAAMADAGKAVSDALGKGERIVYVSVMNRLSVDCDCNGNPDEPDLHDIGILSSRDPVALDQACLDLVYASDNKESAALRERIESRNGVHTLETAEKIGLGSRSYRLVVLDN